MNLLGVLATKLYVAAGLDPVIWKTGHSLIKVKMRELDAPLAGEMSGHMFFAGDYYGFDDALFAAARLLAYVAREGGPLGFAPRASVAAELVALAALSAALEESSGLTRADYNVRHPGGALGEKSGR